jgi:hypothetical protein
MTTLFTMLLSVLLLRIMGCICIVSAFSMWDSSCGLLLCSWVYWCIWNSNARRLQQNFPLLLILLVVRCNYFNLPLFCSTSTTNAGGSQVTSSKTTFKCDVLYTNILTIFSIFHRNTQRQNDPLTYITHNRLQLLRSIKLESTNRA